VTANDLFGITDGGKVCAGVPLEEEIEVEGELGDQGRGGIGQIRSEEICDSGFGEGGHG
jgi:hypothetical protein